MQRDDATLLDISRYAQLAADIRTQEAVLYHIAVIGEAVKRLSSDFRSQHPDIP